MFLKNFLKEYRELRYLAYHDTLTGLLNRNWLYKNINNISLKYVYFIDINDLREINKKGHIFGDNYIKRVVETIKTSNNDILVRYAGDEFILFSNTKNVIVSNDIISVGVSEVLSIESILETINEADMDMIKSKNEIKNQ